MDITIDRSALASALTLAAQVSVRSPVHPVLAHVALAVDSLTLTVSATDLSVSSVTTLEGKGSKDGGCTVDARQLKAIVESMPGRGVRLALDGLTLAVEGGKARFKLPTMPLRDFPAIRRMAGHTRGIPAGQLLSALKAVSFAICDDESRTNLAGIRVEAEGGGFFCIAINGHCAASILTDADINAPTGGATIPTAGVTAICKLLAKLGNEQPAHVAFGKEYMFVASDGDGRTEVSSKLLSEMYPPWRQLDPRASSAATRADVRVPRAALLEALHRAQLVRDTQVRLDISSTGGAVEIYRENPDSSSVRESVDAEPHGATFSVSVSVSYATQAVDHCPDDVVILNVPTGDGLAPVMINGGVYRTIIMPIKRS